MKVVPNHLIANIETTEFRPDSVRLAGWIVHHESPLTSLTLRLNSKVWVEDVPLYDRPDVLKNLYRDVPHTVRSGFDAVAPLDRSNWHDGANTLEIVARQDGAERGEYVLALRDLSREPERVAVPPQILKLHIGQQYGDFIYTGWRI